MGTSRWECSACGYDYNEFERTLCRNCGHDRNLQLEDDDDSLMANIEQVAETEVISEVVEDIVSDLSTPDIPPTGGFDGFGNAPGAGGFGGGGSDGTFN